MSAQSICKPSQPYPIPPQWGDPRNFEWVPLHEDYWCKLCRKYANDSHINSSKHRTRERYPNTYLWYLGEHRQPSQEDIPTEPSPPSGPSRGYEVGVPAPPAGPPPDTSWSLERQSGNDNVERLIPLYPDAIEIAKHIVSPAHQWYRYAVDVARESYWWWSPVHSSISFREDAPGAWCKFFDPATCKNYWYLSDNIWFWEATGSMM